MKNAASLFLYDRSGLEKSPMDYQTSAQNPITNKSIANKQSILLKKKVVRPLYILVAHSYGALYAGYYILKNPELVKGVYK